jgi:hypothetical protein
MEKGSGPPASGDRPFLTRLRRILAEYRRRGGHSRRLNPRRSVILRAIRSEPAQARILSVVDSCIESAARLPQRRRAVIQERRSAAAAILSDHLCALDCHPAFLASRGTDPAIAKLKRLLTDLNVGRWRAMKTLSRSERAALGDSVTTEPQSRPSWQRFSRGSFEKRI